MLKLAHYIKNVRNVESVGKILINRGQRVKKNIFSFFPCSD